MYLPFHENISKRHFPYQKNCCNTTSHNPQITPIVFFLFIFSRVVVIVLGGGGQGVLKRVEALISCSWHSVWPWTKLFCIPFSPSLPCLRSRLFYETDRCFDTLIRVIDLEYYYYTTSAMYLLDTSWSKCKVPVNLFLEKGQYIQISRSQRLREEQNTRNLLVWQRKQQIFNTTGQTIFTGNSHASSHLFSPVFRSPLTLLNLQSLH